MIWSECKVVWIKKKLMRNEGKFIVSEWCDMCDW